MWSTARLTCASPGRSTSLTSRERDARMSSKALAQLGPRALARRGRVGGRGVGGRLCRARGWPCAARCDLPRGQARWPRNARSRPHGAGQPLATSRWAQGTPTRARPRLRAYVTAAAWTVPPSRCAGVGGADTSTMRRSGGGDRRRRGPRSPRSIRACRSSTARGPGSRILQPPSRPPVCGDRRPNWFSAYDASSCARGRSRKPGRGVEDARWQAPPRTGC